MLFRSDLTQIEIVLTDFGLADPDSKGGTPIFASPECFGKKDKKSDIFSFGRVILFLLLKKQQFAKWLFVPIKDQIRATSVKSLMCPSHRRILVLVVKMTSISSRINIQSARVLFDELRRDSKVKLNSVLINAIESIVNRQMSIHDQAYVKELSDHR